MRARSKDEQLLKTLRVLPLRFPLLAGGASKALRAWNMRSYGALFYADDAGKKFVAGFF